MTTLYKTQLKPCPDVCILTPYLSIFKLKKKFKISKLKYIFLIKTNSTLRLK